MPNERFNPVAHDDALVAQMLSDPETKRAYDELEEEYAAVCPKYKGQRAAAASAAWNAFNENAGSFADEHSTL